MSRPAAALALLSFIAAMASCSASTHGSSHQPSPSLQISPTNVKPGGQFTVSLAGIPSSELPLSGEEASLQVNRSGRWSTIYTLFVIMPGMAPSAPAYVRGVAHGPVPAIGILDPAPFRLPAPLARGQYRIERGYSYGSTGHTRQTSAYGFVSVTK